MSERVSQPTTSALLVDLYELTMAESYVAEGLAERPATFQLFCRSLPPGWGYLLAAGLDDLLAHLEELAFGEGDLAYLAQTGRFSARFLDRLADVRFTGDVRAMPEGVAFFPQEPVVEVTAPLLEAQLIETVVLNQVHFQSLLAGKAARCVDAAAGRQLVDFALRRTHGAEAGLKLARASYIAGFDATSDVLAGKAYGIPTAGTMAHSYIECFEDERAAFEAFVRSFPSQNILLIDTYDTLAGARIAVEVGREAAAHGGSLGGVRLDSGDMLELARQVRTILDEGGLPEATIFASGGLDEREVARLLAAGAPIDGFGVGSRLGTSADAPYLDMAYKLVAFDGRPVLKLSEGKATLPAAKQVWRRRDAAGSFAGDVITLADEPAPPQAEPLLVEAMRGGRRVAADSLELARARAGAQRAALPSGCRRLDAETYPVEISAALRDLRDAVTESVRARTG